MVKIGRTGQNGLKWSQMVLKDPKWSKMMKNGQDGQKLSKLPKWSKSPKIVKLVQNGLNGLAVGARRAPTLLVL